MTKDEALKMVNDILDDEMWFPNKYPDEAIPVCFIEALKACKEALEQPAQEARLVSYAPDGATCTLNIDGKEVYFNREHPAQEPVLLNVKTHDDKTYKVEVSAPLWQGLSDDEIKKLAHNKECWMNAGGNLMFDWEYFARAIEQALKEKNHD
jgi:hypothetical protein